MRCKYEGSLTQVLGFLLPFLLLLYRFKTLFSPFYCCCCDRCMNINKQTPDKLYMVLEYMGGGELFHWLKQHRKFTEPRGKVHTD